MTAWPAIELSEVCFKIQDGAHRSPKKLYTEPGPNRFPYLTSKNIRNGYLRLDNIQYCDADFHNEIYSRCNPERGDVLLTKDGANTGNVAINTLYEPYSLLSSVCLLKPNKTKLLSEFLTYYIQSKEGFEQITGQMTGAAIKRVILKTIKASRIPLPPLPEQKRIVSILDEAFSVIDAAIVNTGKNLANARELLESYLNAVFTQKVDGWVEKSLAEVCSITSKLVDPREPEFLNMPHIGAGNMVEMTGEIVEVKTAREEGLKSGKFIFDEKMVLYSKIRPYLMKACRPDFQGLCSADVYPLLPDSRCLDRDYLFHLLMSRHFTDYAISGSDRAGMPKVNRPHLFKYRTYFPDISEQQRIADRLDTLALEARRLESICQRKLDVLTELKQSILQKAFAGELTTKTKEHHDEVVA